MYANSLFCSAFGLLIHLSLGSASGEWSYTNNDTKPEKWAENFPHCDGIMQSPVHIVTSDTKLDLNLKPITIQLNGTNLEQQTYTVANNGHSVQVTFPDNLWRVSLHGEAEGDFCAKQLHFHWGSDSSNGSEHIIDGKQYSLEAHLVNYNCKMYRTYSEASTSPFGLAVLGFWGQHMSTVLATVTMLNATGGLETILGNVKTQTSVNITAFNLTDLLSLVNPASYYRYAGSLTTPPCTPNVIWTIFTKVVPVSSEQLNLLRSLNFPSTESRTSMENNFRPVQMVSSAKSPLPRTIYRSASRVFLTNSFLIVICCLIRPFW
ncbi:Carbonic anhydrase XII [Fasciola hepatica]|uniref:Carbonic anhydrase n=1 Tax=Fasciola hepatica TaxID=6192 RepID=A0A4E0R4A4_FASHE|nr:Carbonic anhydrase XII [Fasciola hepatica]